ncbi:hypothetical protein [Chitinophaga pinensis]|uniref:hypothetical protein n=1 Tax=Chitinophaga pinensis TaxID=79329 RepID=UPI0016474B27|nr:hypothetical protein [Chitinophaga pinensis]
MAKLPYINAPHTTGSATWIDSKRLLYPIATALKKADTVAERVTDSRLVTGSSLYP